MCCFTAPDATSCERWFFSKMQRQVNRWVPRVERLELSNTLFHTRKHERADLTSPLDTCCRVFVPFFPWCSHAKIRSLWRCWNHGTSCGRTSADPAFAGTSPRRDQVGPGGSGMHGLSERAWAGVASTRTTPSHWGTLFEPWWHGACSKRRFGANQRHQFGSLMMVWKMFYFQYFLGWKFSVW